MMSDTTTKTPDEESAVDCSTLLDAPQFRYIVCYLKNCGCYDGGSGDWGNADVSQRAQQPQETE